MFFVFIAIEYAAMQVMRALGYPVGGSHGKEAKGGPASYRLNDLLACTLLGSFQQIGLLVRYAAFWVTRTPEYPVGGTRADLRPPLSVSDLKY